MDLMRRNQIPYESVSGSSLSGHKNEEPYYLDESSIPIGYFMKRTGNYSPSSKVCRNIKYIRISELKQYLEKTGTNCP